MKKLHFSRFGKIVMLLIAFFAMSATIKTMATGLYYQTTKAGDWNDPTTWQESTNGSSWTAATNYPNGTNATAIKVFHKVTVTTNDISAFDLLIFSSGGELDLGTNTLTLIGSYAHIYGHIYSTIQDDSTYGKIVASTAVNIEVSNNTTIHMSVAAGATRPSFLVDYKIIETAGSISEFSPVTASKLIPTNLWRNAWNYNLDSKLLKLTYQGVTYKSKGTISSNWRTSSTWESSTNGSTYSVVSDYPTGTNADLVIVNKQVTLHNNETVNNLQVEATGDLAVSLFTLNLLGDATIAGALTTIISNNTTYGKITSSSTGVINIDNMKLMVLTAATAPTTIVQYDLITAPNAVVTSNPVLPNDMIWNSALWSMGTGNHQFSITYNGTVTSINATKLAKAYAVNSKLIYSDGEVYNAMGAKVATGIGRQEVALTFGIYIVKSASGVQKVFVK